MREKLWLQIAVALAGLVPVTAGAAGAFDPALLAFTGAPQLLAHAAYLSGLLLGIGLGFWSCIPAIETQSARFSLLTCIVALGGMARLWMGFRLGVWNVAVIAPLLMELGVTPALWHWQRRLAAKG